MKILNNILGSIGTGKPTPITTTSPTTAAITPTTTRATNPTAKSPSSNGFYKGINILYFGINYILYFDIKKHIEIITKI